MTGTNDNLAMVFALGLPLDDQTNGPTTKGGYSCIPTGHERRKAAKAQHRAAKKAHKAARKAEARAARPASRHAIPTHWECSEAELTAIAKGFPLDAPTKGWVILSTEGETTHAFWTSGWRSAMKELNQAKGKVYLTIPLDGILLARVQERQADLASGLV